MCEELPPHGILLLYISAPGHIFIAHLFCLFIMSISSSSSFKSNFLVNTEYIAHSVQPNASPSSSEENIPNFLGFHSGGVNLGVKGNGGTLND